MTTIKLKNGSGAPTAGDLVQGEPALDLTNKRLYTEDSGGTVIEVGTNPGTDVTFADNRKAIFGAGSDLQIYHDGSNSYIDDTATGHLFIRSNGDGIYLRSNTNEEIAHFNVNGSVKAYYDNSLKLATTSTGIDVTGQVKATSDFIAADSGGVARGYLFGTSGGLFARFNSGGTFQVQESGSTKLTVNSTGINVTGTVTSTSFGSQLATTLFEQNVLKSSVTASSGAFVRMAVSSSSNPTYAFEDDTDTGVFTSGANTLNFGTAGTERLRIDSGGDISFYEDTGTTAKFSWSSSNETIAIGTGASSTATISAFSRTVSANLPSALRIIENTGASSYWDIGANNGSSPNLNFYVNANTTPKVTFASSGNVGIGTSSPASPTGFGTGGILHLKGSTGNDCSIVLEGLSGSGGRQEIGASGGALQFYRGAATGSMAESMRIDSSGNLLVGTTDTVPSNNGASGDAGVAISPDGVFRAARSDNVALDINRMDSDGAIADFRKDGTTVGSIGSYNDGASAPYFADAGNVGIRLSQASTDDIVPCTSTGADRDNAINLGSSSARFKDLYLSGDVIAPNIVASNGVFLGGTSNANKLDDYEEGTWTPTISSGSTSPTYSVQTGTYVKIGKQVFFSMYITTTGGTLNSSHLIFSGLPFSSTGSTGGASVSYSNSGFRANNKPTNFFTSGTQIEVYETDGSTLIGTEVQTASFDLRINGQYEVA